MDAPDDRLFTVSEVAEYFRVDPESDADGFATKLLGINLGRGPGWRIRYADLQSFIDERHTKKGQRPEDTDIYDEVNSAP